MTSNQRIDIVDIAVLLFVMRDSRRKKKHSQLIKLNNMTDKVQKIREEVERLKSNLIHGACASQIAMETRCKEEAYDEVISLLDSMQEEPRSEELDEAADNCYFHNHAYARESFIEGANWQKEQIIPNTTDAMIGLPYENKDGGYTHLIDVSRPLPVGNNKIAIIFKED